MVEERQAPRQHKVILNDRSGGVLNGIKDILAFDVSEILLETEQGMLMIKGNDLHVKRLTLEKGEIDISGRIDSLLYSDVNKPKSSPKQTDTFQGRLFR